MKNYIKQRVEQLRGFVYGDGLMGSPVIIDRFKYRGRGRPKTTDYITVQEAQKQLNRFHEELIVKRYDTTGTIKVDK